MVATTFHPRLSLQPASDPRGLFRRFAWPLTVAAGILMTFLVVNWLLVAFRTEPAVRTETDTQLIPTAQGTMQVRVSGNPNGPPVLLVHGLMGSMHWFDRIAPLLEPTHQLVAVDLLGCGGSDKPGRGNYTVVHQAAAVGEVLAALKLSPVTAVGHSLGGAVVTSLAEQRPELVDRLVVIDSPTNTKQSTLGFKAQLSRQPLVGPAIKTFLNLAGTNDLGSIAFAPGFDISSGFDQSNQPILDIQRMTYTAFLESQRTFRNFTDQEPLDLRIARTGKPLLVLFGDQDQIALGFKNDVVRYALLPGARVEVLEGIGHSPQIESPLRIAEILRGFTQDVAVVSTAQR